MKHFQQYQIKNLQTITGGRKNCPANETKEGYIVTADLQDWRQACRDGKYDRRDVSMTMND